MRKRTAVAVTVASTLALSACGGAGGTSPDHRAGNAAGTPQSGGELTVLEDTAFTGSWPSGLDPATNATGGANLDLEQAVYGGLFLMEADEDGKNAHVEPNQAESGKLSDDGKTFTMKLRPGIAFSDGTPMDAQAVLFNWQRDISTACTCKPTWELADPPFTVVDPLTVQIDFARPNGAVLAAMTVSNFNWIVSPTALQKMGEDAFKVTPVGAGPFTVVQDQISTRLELKKNPAYFEKGLPYLDKLTFQSIGGDQPAYQAVVAGQAEAYVGMSTVSLIGEAQKNDRLQVTIEPATSPYVVQLNTLKPPFDNPKARRAIYAATDFGPIAKGIFQGKYPVTQSFTGPGGLFYHSKVDGYQGYDLALAKKLVKEVGGISIQLTTLKNFVAEQVDTALQTQWKKAGIDVTLSSLQTGALVQEYTSGDWTTMLQTAGAWDPAVGNGVGFIFSSSSPFTGVKDPQLDALLNQGEAAVDPGERDKRYQQAAELIARQYYGPFGPAFAPANITVQGVHGPGLTTAIPANMVNTAPIWGEVWRERG